MVFIGPSGSGKDTQAKYLQNRYGYDMVSTGDLTRAEMAKDTKRAKFLKKHYDMGHFDVIGDTVFELLGEHLDTLESLDNLIFNGVVRVFEQVDKLDSLLQDKGIVVTDVLNFQISDDEVTKRLIERGRPDDYEEAIRSRLDSYHKDAKPIIEEYESRGILKHIDAARSEEAVHVSIVDKLNL